MKDRGNSQDQNSDFQMSGARRARGAPSPQTQPGKAAQGTCTCARVLFMREQNTGRQNQSPPVTGGFFPWQLLAKTVLRPCSVEALSPQGSFTSACSSSCPLCTAAKQPQRWETNRGRRGAGRRRAGGRDAAGQQKHRAPLPRRGLTAAGRSPRCGVGSAHRSPDRGSPSPGTLLRHKDCLRPVFLSPATTVSASILFTPQAVF